MKNIAILGAAALAFVSVNADAAVTVNFAGGSGATAPGTTVFQNFDSFASGAALPSGTSAFAYGASIAGVAARPAYGSTGNFAAVLGGGNWTVNFAPTSIFSFVLGSLDTYNSLTLHFVGGGSTTYVGGQIINDLIFPSGDQISGETNGVVSYNAGGGPLINGATFSSRENSFEFDNLARAVPEPATWALMILGFGAIGGALRRRRTSVAYA
ncbi:PEPxxWA-CTERM sorting domain-containing protein [uncultured Sphingomonas sp.]|uniref:PEPxxWA-CTERM sorting domain-containing protein n=1 Tax=uncultured Sphingomonas sp. TaxID=158754 RepID=UPI0026234D29|nr:PEPxxWA-CTERM sorting domain-containing protein [uncultured Sphingomonas sp.]